MLNEVMHKWHKWHALTAGEKRILLAMAVLLPAAWVGLRAMGTKKMLAITCRPLVVSRADYTGIAPDRIALLTATAARRCLPPGNCLPQALALCWWLRKNGLDAQIRIGVKTPVQPLLAHAWVELGGKSLDSTSAAYSTFQQPLAASRHIPE